MAERRRPIRFPPDWFSAEDFSPPGGGEQREEGFSRPAHAAKLMDGVRHAFVSKPRDPVVPDDHIFFAARTWKDRPSLRRNLDQINAKIHRVLPDGAVVASWSSPRDYDETKHYIRDYAQKQTKTSDLDYIESVKGLDFRDKLGRSILEILEEHDEERAGLLELIFYSDYTSNQINMINEAVTDSFSPRGLTFIRLIAGVGRFTSLWEGPLHLAADIARRVEAVALVEQAGELKPAAAGAPGATTKRNLVVAQRPNLPGVAVLDSGVHAAHPLLSGIVLTGDPSIDHIDASPDGGHGTFVAGVIAYGEHPEQQIENDTIEPRAVIYPRKLSLGGMPGGVNLDSYQELANVVESVRQHTRVFTASISTSLPIDSDTIHPLAINIDLLSAKYGVLFVLPTGNLPNIRYGSLSHDQPNFHDPTTWFTDPNAQMGRPGEAFNAVTVSSYAERQVAGEYSQAGEITMYSRRGPGPKGFPKPDVAEAGGNCIVKIDPGDPHFVELESDPHPDGSITNLRVPDGSRKSMGTSFAVPKIAFALAKLVDVFVSLNESRFAPLLSKAYLVHIARCPENAGPFPDTWGEDERAANRHLLYGYGVPDRDALDGVLPTELCFFAGGELGRKQRHVYTLAFPDNVLRALPELRLRVTLAYFTVVDPTALDADLYSLVEITPVVRWGAKTLTKHPRGAPLTDFYPLKSFEVRFAKPRDGEPEQKGQPTIELTMRDRVREDRFVQSYALIISLVSATGELLVHDLIREIIDVE